MIEKMKDVKKCRMQNIECRMKAGDRITKARKFENPKAA
jgi:hypothetical protein